LAVANRSVIKLTDDGAGRKARWIHTIE
jgi:hypothetical protein